MVTSMPDCGVLLSTLLNEVRALSEAVTIQGRKTDAILATLSINTNADARNGPVTRYEDEVQLAFMLSATFQRDIVAGTLTTHAHRIIRSFVYSTSKGVPKADESLSSQSSLCSEDAMHQDTLMRMDHLFECLTLFALHDMRRVSFTRGDDLRLLKLSPTS